jgi:hypothetical protein
MTITNNSSNHNKQGSKCAPGGRVISRLTFTMFLCLGVVYVTHRATACEAGTCSGLADGTAGTYTLTASSTACTYTSGGVQYDDVCWTKRCPKVNCLCKYLPCSDNPNQGCDYFWGGTPGGTVTAPCGSGVTTGSCSFSYGSATVLARNDSGAACSAKFLNPGCGTCDTCPN